MEWRQVEGWPYQVSSSGRVMCARTFAPVAPKSQGRYLQVRMTDGGREGWCLVSRLVYEAFVGPIPEGYHVHHHDGDKLNNRLENLQCVSPQEHFALHGKEGCGTLTDEDVQRVRQLLREGRLLHREIAEMFGVSRPLVSLIASGRKRRMSGGPVNVIIKRRRRVKLTDKDVQRVRQLLREGNLSKQAIADMFEVSRTLISLIASGKKRSQGGGAPCPAAM